jgi:hypothetical protein
MHPVKQVAFSLLNRRIEVPGAPDLHLKALTFIVVICEQGS